MCSKILLHARVAKDKEPRDERGGATYTPGTYAKGVTAFLVGGVSLSLGQDGKNSEPKMPKPSAGKCAISPAFRKTPMRIKEISEYSHLFLSNFRKKHTCPPLSLALYVHCFFRPALGRRNFWRRICFPTRHNRLSTQWHVQST